MARALEKAADKLASATGSQDGESQKLSEQRARAQELRERLAETGRQLAQAGDPERPDARVRPPRRVSPDRPAGPDRRARRTRRQTGQSGQAGQSGQSGQQSGASGSKAAGDTGKSGDGQAGGGAGGTDLEKLREQYQKQLQETRELAEQMRREDPAFARGGGGGFSFDAPTSIGLSAPGTEAFKQDFAKWEEMRRQATQVLDQVEAVAVEEAAGEAGARSARRWRGRQGAGGLSAAGRQLLQGASPGRKP